ncbi:hypothetical protein NVT68_002630 [Clostridium botulinum]|nr:hypothetical protein [Clostridium botulinum]MDI6918521.1 hypothetical protein [Clostridium botulinum]
MYIINPNLKFRGLSYGNNPKMIVLHCSCRNKQFQGQIIIKKEIQI